MKEIKYFEILGEKDQTEGRGGTRETGICFEEKQDAINFACSSVWSRRFGVMGVSKGSSSYVKPVKKIVYDSVEEYCKKDGCLNDYNKSLIEQKRQYALNKLTDEEKKILGLS